MGIQMNGTVNYDRIHHLFKQDFGFSSDTDQKWKWTLLKDSFMKNVQIRKYMENRNIIYGFPKIGPEENAKRAAVLLINSVNILGKGIKYSYAQTMFQKIKEYGYEGQIEAFYLVDDAYFNVVEQFPRAKEGEPPVEVKTIRMPSAWCLLYNNTNELEAASGRTHYKIMLPITSSGKTYHDSYSLDLGDHVFKGGYINYGCTLEEALEDLISMYFNYIKYHDSVDQTMTKYADDFIDPEPIEPEPEEPEIPDYSDYDIGGDELPENPNDKTLATEKAVNKAIEDALQTALGYAPKFVIDDEGVLYIEDKANDTSTLLSKDNPVLIEDGNNE